MKRAFSRWGALSRNTAFVSCAAMVAALVVWGGLFALGAAAPAFAQDGRLTNPLDKNASDLPSLLKLVLSVVIALAFPAIVLFIVYAGFRYVVASAQGQPDKVKEINKTLLWAVVGALLILGSWALVSAIQATVCQIAPKAAGCS
ncbi:MAG: hypothetical protein KatS3mg099_056 [Candidatus Parcubacteria bacterium]|nr:MAG: hypothetical protein KatS3mg099_056 [Candidatus Parcubacteria bacterium]